MKKTSILYLIVIVSVLASIMMPYNVHAEETSLNQLLWDSEHVQVSSQEYTLTSSNPKFTVNTDMDLNKHNIGFQIKVQDLPSSPLYYVSKTSIYITLKDNNDNTRLYSLYDKDTKLIGSEDYTNQIVSWLAMRPEDTGFNPSQVKNIAFEIDSTETGWTIWITDIRAYPEIQLYPEGAVIICADGAPYPGVPDMLLPKLDEYGYKMNLATSDVQMTPNWPLIEEMSLNGHDIGVYARMFEGDRVTLLLESEFQYNTYGIKDVIEQHTGKPVTFLQANRHLTDERTDERLTGFPIVKGSSLPSTNKVALPFWDYYGGSFSDISRDLNGITEASETGSIYVLFDHFYDSSRSYAKTQEEINQIVDHIHAQGLKVITWTQLQEDLFTYLGSPPPEPLPSVFFTVEMNGDGFNVIEDGIIVEHFGTAQGLADYVNDRAEEWEVNK